MHFDERLPQIVVVAGIAGAYLFVLYVWARISDRITKIEPNITQTQVVEMAADVTQQSKETATKNWPTCAAADLNSSCYPGGMPLSH